MKPNSSQIEAAKSIVGKFGVNYGSVGTDIHQNTAVMAIYAVFLGKLASVPDEYKSCITNVELSAEPEPIEGVLVPVEDYERTKTILEGISIDTTERTLTISEDAAVLMRDPNDATAFPEVGIYVSFAHATAMVEGALALKPADTPPADDPAKIDLESMTVDQLKAFAVEKNIDLQDIRLKADIIAAIREFGF